MAANINPIFGKEANVSSVVITTGNTARDGSGTLFDAFTAGADGSLLLRMSFTNASPAVGAAVAKVFRIFITDTTGANPRLYKEIAAPAATSSNTAIGQVAPQFIIQNGLFLAAGQKVQVSQSVRATSADDTHAIAEGVNY